MLLRFVHIPPDCVPLFSAFFLPKQQPERKWQRPPAVSGGVGLGPDQQERLHGIPLLWDLGAAETRRGWLVRCQEGKSWKPTELWFHDPNAAPCFTLWDLGSSCCPRRKENTLTFLSNRRARKVMRSCDRSLRWGPETGSNGLLLLFHYISNIYTL